MRKTFVLATAFFWLLLAAPAFADTYWYVNAYNMTIPTNEMPGHGCEYLRTVHDRGWAIFVFRCNKDRNGRVDAYMHFTTTTGAKCVIIIEKHSVAAGTGCSKGWVNANTADIYPSKS